MGLFSWLTGSSGGDLSRAALGVVQDDLRVKSVWPGDSKAVIDRMQENIAAAMRWTSTVADGRARRAYESWLDFYQGRVDEARDELTTHAKQKRMAKYETECNERLARADAIAKTLPRPEPQIAPDIITRRSAL